MPDETRSERPSTYDECVLRPADAVMRPERAGAAYPNALSFARTAMATLVAGRWRIEKLRVELDREGRGEVLYRFVGAGWTFHFFLVSIKLPEEVKLDRNFAQSWDAMGVLCQGEWTPEREQLLRQEVPKQRAGRADYDTLMYARGNRSGRLFDHVVDSLAAGRQPDLGQISTIGYILRTTAFIGNGQLGTRPLAGYEPDHPFRAPYHAQIASAFLLREYVFDLVDTMARARSQHAVRLCRSYRRYLGLGNSAATGLVPFIVNHPHIVHRWQLTWERAIASARSRRIAPRSPAADRLMSLLHKAEGYFRDGARRDAAVFADATVVADDLAAIAGALAAADADPSSSLGELACAFAERHGHAETSEIVNAIILELCPDIVRACSLDFYADETMELDVTMPIGQVRALLARDYGWAFESQDEADLHYFWYRSVAAPRDVRRGFRGLAPEVELETAMDVIWKIRQLRAALATLPDDMPCLELLIARPDLRRIATRVQTTAPYPYAELRGNLLAKSFSPFGPIRFVLAFYGMEKFEAAFPKSVRGSFLQGAPIAEDVEAGRDGDWPFPRVPEPGGDGPATQDLAWTVAPDVDPQRASILIARDVLTVAPIELIRACSGALQGAGVELGVADEAARLVELAQGLDGNGVATLLAHLRAGSVGVSRAIKTDRIGSAARRLIAGDLSPLVAAPLALDVACYEAAASPDGVGAVEVRCGAGAAVAAALAVRAAERGFASLLLWGEGALTNREAGFAVAAATAAGVRYFAGDIANLARPDGIDPALDPPRATAEVAASLDEAWRRIAEHSPAIVTHFVGSTTGAVPVMSGPAVASYVLVCARPPATSAPTALSRSRLAQALGRLARIDAHDVARFRSSALAQERRRWHQQGFQMSVADLAALDAAAARSFISADEEARVRPDGFDPLRSF